MKKIKLTQGKFALVDDEDFERVSQYKWLAHKNNLSDNIWYAARNITVSKNKRKRIYLHRYIMNVSEIRTPYVDHVNHNGLDNRKENLRLCSMSQNQANRATAIDSLSGYKGVSYQKRDKIFVASIVCNKEYYYLGCFKAADEAALAYNKKAIELHGEFAYLNKI